MRARTAAPSLCSLANRARATHGHNPSMGISVPRQPAAQPSVGNLVPRQPAAQPQRGDLGAGAACGATLAWDLGAEAACGAIQHGGLRRGQHGAEATHSFSYATVRPHARTSQHTRQDLSPARSWAADAPRGRAQLPRATSYHVAIGTTPSSASKILGATLLAVGFFALSKQLG